MKKILILLIIFLGTTTTIIAKTFSDISKQNPYYLATRYLSAKAMIKGYSDGKFKPYNEINRAELLKILLEGAKIEIKTPETHCFNDVAYTQWYSPYICTAKNLGIIKGYADGSFKPWQAVNKVEAIKMISKVYGWEAKTIIEQPFEDTPLGEWYTQDLYIAKNKNLLPETGENYYPAANMTRGSVAEIIYRFLVITELQKEKYSNDLDIEIEELINVAEKETLEIESTEKIKDSSPEKIKLADGEINIILSWEKEQEKKSSDNINFEEHLIKPDEEEIYFLHKIDKNINIILENGENSEKIIIRNLEEDMQEGNYEFFVYKYSGDKSFNEAKVKIEVFDSKGLAAIYTPQENDNLIWKTFELNSNGELIDINKFGYCEVLTYISIICPEGATAKEDLQKIKLEAK